jgi:hypothetical protein
VDAAGAVAASFGCSGACGGHTGENSLAAGGHNAVTREYPGADGGGDARRWLGASSPLPTLGQLAGDVDGGWLRKTKIFFWEEILN